MAAYTTIDNPELYFQTEIYTGNGTDGRTITLSGSEDMQPDLIWIKNRGQTDNHHLFDSVRGVNKAVSSSTTNAELDAPSSGYVSGFASDGFTVTSGSSADDNVNKNTETYVAWCWKAGTSFTNDASATSVGSVDSTGSINTTAGFSIMSWTSLASGSNYTIAHGISKPAVILMKGRHESNNWMGYHHKNTSAPETDYLMIDDTAATADYPVWNDTAPTSSVMSLGTWSGLDDGGTMIAYIFAEKQGFSKFGSYTGNNSNDGNFVWLGFRPAFLLAKDAGSGQHWHLIDNTRETSNDDDAAQLSPNNNSTESTVRTDRGTAKVDFLSNGFKLRSDGSSFNGTGSFIYLAFAEAPFVNSEGVPCNAR